MNNPKLTDNVDPGNIQTIEQLWESLHTFVKNRCRDNKHTGYNGYYPISIREMQMRTLHSLVNAIQDFHNENEE